MINPTTTADYLPVPTKVLCADPAWPTKWVNKTWRDSKNEQVKSSAAHYSLMSAKEILTFPMPPLQDNAVLFLWRLSNMQELAIEVCKAWGFRPYGEIVWNKLTATGKPWFGMGHLVRGSHETCLIGIHGKRIKPDALNIRDVFSAKYTGKHSGKPEEFYDLVEKMYVGGPWTEIFARRYRPGWLCYGDEVGKY